MNPDLDTSSAMTLGLSFAGGLLLAYLLGLLLREFRGRRS